MSKSRRLRGSALINDEFRSRSEDIRMTLQLTIFGGLIGPSLFIFFLYDKGFWEFLALLVGYIKFEKLGLTTALGYGAWRTEWDAVVVLRWLALFFAIFSGSLSGWLTSLYILKKGQQQILGTRIRDGEPRLVTPEVLNMNTQARIMDKRNNERHTKYDVYISDSKILLTDKMLSQSTMIVGSPGSGKSQALSQLLQQVQQNGERCLVVDANADYYRKFGRPGDVVLSLHSELSQKWDFWSEKINEDQLAQGLIPLRSDDSSESRFWQDGARSVLAGVFRHAKSLEELYTVANYSSSELRAFLTEAGDLSRAQMGIGDDSKLAEGMAATALSSIKTFLSHLGHHSRTRENAIGESETAFSLKTWVLDSNDKRSVFLIARESDWDQTLPLITLWLDIVTKAVFELPEDDSQRGSIFIDELASVNYINSLPRFTEKSRKYGWRCFLGIQSVSQLTAIYGEATTANLLNNLQSKIVFKVSDFQLAEDLSKVFSSEEIELANVSQTLTKGGGATVSVESISKLLITPAQIMNLPERTAFAKLANSSSMAKLYWSYVRYKTKNGTYTKYESRVANPFLSTIQVQPYRSQLDRNRHSYLNSIKRSCDQFLQVFHEENKTDLSKSIEGVKAALNGAFAVKERVDNVVYEIIFNKELLTVIRDATTVSVDLRKYSPHKGSRNADDTLE